MLNKFRYRFFNFWTISTLVLLAFFALALLYPLGSLFLNSFRVYSPELYHLFYEKVLLYGTWPFSDHRDYLHPNLHRVRGGSGLCDAPL